MSYLTMEMLQKGYLLFPKALFEEQMKMKKNEGAADNFEAFFLVLKHVNYSSTRCCIKGHHFECMRGESVLSLSHWAEILGWNRSHTRYFFNSMFTLGLIEKLVNPFVTHIRIPDYDLLTGKSRPQSCKRKDTGNEGFDSFWQQYHDITEHDKVNIGRARREWKKLSVEEKRLAIANIDEYHDHLSSSRYCKQAASYLADKSFKDEYED
ncbi:hypothetical protein [Bacteroides sp.]|uniref:hypothetical protein n=1 Tax=Bacteroides sp. TaxID=29523 RepID=UPI002620E98B|nr:hypothetical protein [Bacteroides sp.]